MDINGNDGHKDIIPVTCVIWHYFLQAIVLFPNYNSLWNNCLEMVLEFHLW